MAQNMLMGAKLSEYHTGYRAFTRKVLETVPIERNSDDFVFDNQMLSQIHFMGFTHCRGHLPGQVLRGGVVHQLPTKLALRPRLPVDGPAISFDQDGSVSRQAICEVGRV